MQGEALLKVLINKWLDFLFVTVAARFFLIFDRFLRHRLEFAQGKSSLANVQNCGEDVRFHGYCKIVSPSRLKIGAYVRIGTGCHINAIGGVSIGENTQISRDVVIYSSMHDYEGGAIPYDDGYLTKPVEIGRSVWVGMNVAILPGVTIGDGAIIGLGAVVTKDVPPMAIVVGSASRHLKDRDRSRFDELEKKGAFFGKIFPNN